MGIDIIPAEAVSIEEGQHTGKIQDVKEEVRGEGKYVYIDVYVTVDGLKKGDGSPVLIKEGFPKNLSKESKLGKLGLRFGLSEPDLDKSVKEGLPVDITKFVKLDKSVKYMVLNEGKNGKIYARIVENSLKPNDPSAELAVDQKDEAPDGASVVDEIFGDPVKTKS